MKKSNKLISILLAAAMIFAISPLSAFAAESDGVPTTIDVTGKTSVSIDSYIHDEDGYILTGSGECRISVEDACSLTLNNVTAQELGFFTSDDSLINMVFEGTNEFSDRIAFFKEHLVFEGSDDAVIKASRIYNGGNNVATVTLNSGNMIFEAIGESHRTLVCGNLIINGGTVTASNDSRAVAASPIKLNSGTLNIICTSEEYAAVNDYVTINKGALLTLSGTYGLIDTDYAGILKADGLAESDYFFVRYDAESEFAPVYDINTALDGKTYAEIKIDTHEHITDSHGKCVCGYECPHESYTDSKCDACGNDCPHKNYTNDLCDKCGIRQADYSGYDAAMDRYFELVDEYYDVLVDETKGYIIDKVQEIADEYLGNTGVKNNYTVNEQYILDGIADGVNEICDTIEKGVADGTLLIPDYTEIEAKIAEFEKTHTGEEYADFIAEIKADLAAIKEANPENHAEAADDIAAIEAKIEKVANCKHMCHQGGIMGFFWRIVNFFSKLFGLNPVCECGVDH